MYITVDLCLPYALCLCCFVLISLCLNHQHIVDLRDPSTIPLNFTKSINLALSERGLTSMVHTERKDLIEKVQNGTIPMYGRMIHGKDRGQLWEAAQQYDTHGRVGNMSPINASANGPSPSTPLTERH